VSSTTAERTAFLASHERLTERTHAVAQPSKANDQRALLLSAGRIEPKRADDLASVGPRLFHS
jgi:hypothetical protein